MLCMIAASAAALLGELTDPLGPFAVRHFTPEDQATVAALRERFRRPPAFHTAFKAVLDRSQMRCETLRRLSDEVIALHTLPEPQQSATRRRLGVEIARLQDDLAAEGRTMSGIRTQIDRWRAGGPAHPPEPPVPPLPSFPW